jgi:hypothetical protein
MSDEEFLRQYVSDLTDGKMTPEQLAQQQLEEAGGLLGAGAMGVLEGAVPVFGKQAREALTSPALREQQRADYPMITALGEFIGGIVPGVGTTALASKLAGPTASIARQALTSAGVEAATGGATAAAKGGDIMDVALSSLLGGTLGGAGGFAQGKGLAKVRSAKQEALSNNPEYVEQVKQVNKLADTLDKSRKKLARVEGDLESEKIGLRTAAEKNLDTLKSNLQKDREKLDALLVKAEKAPPSDKTSTEYQALQQYKDDVKRLQRQFDLEEKRISDLEGRAATQLRKEKQQAVAAAEREVAKAEERVFSAEEKAEINDALLKIMRQREGEVASARKAKARNERIKREQAKKEAEAAPVVETPAPIPVEETPMTFGRQLSQREIELLEDFVASGKKLRDIERELENKISRSTLSRRFKELGITPESAKANVAKRAEEKAALEAAAQDVVPEPAITPTPKVQLEKVPKVSRDILSAADKRKLQQQEATSSIQQEAELGRYGRAQERKQATEAAAVPTPEKSRFGAEIQIRKERLGKIGNDLSKAIQMREDALAALQRAQPEARPALAQQVKNAEQAIGQKAQEFDDAVKAFEEETFTLAARKEPIVRTERGIVASDEQRYQEAQALLAQMKNVSPGMMQRLMAASPEVIIKMFSGPAISEFTDEDVKAVLTNQ